MRRSALLAFTHKLYMEQHLRFMRAARGGNDSDTIP